MGQPRSDEEELARIARCRELQRMLFDGGLAGICVPAEYGGQGLTMAHQDALNREIAGYDYPAETQIPTFTPCMAVILEFGTEEQKKRHIPPILRGETFWMQFLSEPSGGSDVAGAQTTAIRDGDEWVMNGSKIWTTGRLVGGLGAVPGPDQLGRPQAPGPDRVHAADPPAGHRDPPHRNAQWLQGVLPGVHDRRPDPRHRADRRGRSGLDRRYPLDVPRAHRQRRFALRDPTGRIRRPGAGGGARSLLRRAQASRPSRPGQHPAS